MTEPRTGIYPGTFDPITIGHLDVVKRATKVVDRLIIGIAANEEKGPLFSVDDRVAMVQDDINELVRNKEVNGATIEVMPFTGLLVSFAEEAGARLIIRGLRAVSDFEYEFQMVGMNSRIQPDIETVFLMASDRHQFISSRFVKEICRLGGDISQFVTPTVAARLQKAFGRA